MSRGFARNKTTCTNQCGKFRGQIYKFADPDILPIDEAITCYKNIYVINFRFSQATYGNIWECSHVFAYSQRQVSAILRPCEEDIAHATQAQYLSMSRGLRRNFVPRPWCHPHGPMAPQLRGQSLDLHGSTTNSWNELFRQWVSALV